MGLLEGEAKAGQAFSPKSSLNSVSHSRTLQRNLVFCLNCLELDLYLLPDQTKAN